jgi:hypothetical protein
VTGAWKGGLTCSRAVDIASNTGLSQGIVLSASGSATYTKGAWTTLIASTAYDSAWLMFAAETFNSSGTAVAIDVGFGAGGSEITVIANLCFSLVKGTGNYYMFPVAISAGTRVAGRVSSSVLSDNVLIQCHLMADTYASAGSGGQVDTYGFNTGSNLGTTVDAGSTMNSKGAYSQITGSTAADISGFTICFDDQNNSGGSSGGITYLIDIAAGASGSEVVIVPNLFMAANMATNSALLWPAVTPFLPIQIPAGSRISARATCNTTITPDRTIGVTLYGMRM